MGERIARFKLKRELGYRYYVEADEEGWLCVFRSIVKNPRKDIPGKKQKKEADLKDPQTEEQNNKK